MRITNEIFIELLNKMQNEGVKLSTVSRKTGIPYHYFTNFKKGQTSVKEEYYQLIIEHYPEFIENKREEKAGIDYKEAYEITKKAFNLSEKERQDLERENQELEEKIRILEEQFKRKNNIG